VLLSLSSLTAQQVDRQNIHERVWAIVPIIGKGTAEDPKRPAYIPAPPPPGQAPAPNPIIGFSMQVSDDGKFALVQFVARDRAAFKELLADTRPEVKVFEKGKATRTQIEQAFRVQKRDFDLDKPWLPWRTLR
jgi:hypothetical protein